MIELCDFFHGNYYSALTGISKRGSCVSSREAASEAASLQETQLPRLAEVSSSSLL